MKTTPLFARGTVARDPSWDANVELPAAAVAPGGAGYAARIAAAGRLASALPVDGLGAAAPNTPLDAAPTAAPEAGPGGRATRTQPHGPCVVPVDPFEAMVRPEAPVDPWARPARLTRPANGALVPILELLSDPQWPPEEHSTFVAHRTCGRTPSGGPAVRPEFFGTAK